MDLLSLIRPWEEGEASEELDHDATKGPHVDLLCVGEDAKHYVWCTVEPTLDVGVDDFVLKAATSEVCDGDSALILLFHKNVFGLKIAVNDAKLLQVAQPREQLDGKASNEAVLESLIVIHLDELIEVDRVQLKHDAEMITPDEVVQKFHDAFHLIRVVLFQE